LPLRGFFRSQVSSFSFPPFQVSAFSRLRFQHFFLLSQLFAPSAPFCGQESNSHEKAQKAQKFVTFKSQLSGFRLPSPREVHLGP
jgi:hypothetical protein